MNYVDFVTSLYLQIRKQAIKDLPRLCQDNKNYTQRIADILAQLLLAQNSTELSVVHNSLMSLFKLDAKGLNSAFIHVPIHIVISHPNSSPTYCVTLVVGTLAGIFSQILNGDDLSREQCLKFLTIKLKSQGQEILNKESEELLIAESKKVLQVTFLL
jgi:hypothetical protein